MRNITRAFAVLMLSCAASWAAETTPEHKPVAPPHFDCTAEQATPIAYQDLMANIEQWVGRCVRLRILTRGYFAYADLADYYRAGAYTAENDERKSLGMYVKNDEDRDKLFGHRQIVDVVALAYTCSHLSDIHRAEEKALEAEGKTTIIMAIGYCHYTGNPVLFVSAFKVVDPGPLRFAGQAAADKYGNLDPLLPKDPDYAEAWSRIVRRFDAVRRHDIDALIGSVGHDAKDVQQELDDPKSGLHFLVGAKALPPIKFFRVRIPAPDPADQFIGAGCVCKTADCTDRWPIHSSDLNWTTAWPYACLRVERTDGEYD
jgi:hypothetical protein